MDISSRKVIHIEIELEEIEAMSLLGALRHLVNDNRGNDPVYQIIDTLENHGV